MDHGFGLDVPETLAELCRPERLALVVYDMQVGIVRQLPDGREVTKTVAGVLDAARAGGAARDGPRVRARRGGGRVRLARPLGRGTGSRRHLLRGWLVDHGRRDDRAPPPRRDVDPWKREKTAMSLRDPNVSNPNRRKRVGIVISNPAVSTTTGWPVGFWWSDRHPQTARACSRSAMMSAASSMPIANRTRLSLIPSSRRSSVVFSK